jgi:HlyD family secretion protein
MTAAWPVRRYLWGGVFAFCLLLGFAGVWSVTARIDGAVMASGQIALPSQRHVLQHPAGGRISGILIAEGEIVAAGQALVTLDDPQLQAEAAILQAQYLTQLARRARLEAERDGQDHVSFDPELFSTEHPLIRDLMAAERDLFAARQISQARQAAQLAQRRAQIGSQIGGITAQLAAIDLQHDLTLRELAGQQSLFNNGLTPSARVLALARDAAMLQGRSAELAAAQAEAADRQAEIALQEINLASTRRQEALAELHLVEAALTELAERRRAIARALADLTLRAPVAGVVHDLRIGAVGAVIRPAEPVLVIIPADIAPIVTALVDPRDVALIGPGQDVTLRIAALARDGPAELAGVVAHVSADVLRHDAGGPAHYRADIILTDGADLPLRMGMPAEVFIRTGPRRPLAYLADPLLHYFQRGRGTG